MEWKRRREHVVGDNKGGDGRVGEEERKGGKGRGEEEMKSVSIASECYESGI